MFESSYIEKMNAVCGFNFFFDLANKIGNKEHLPRSKYTDVIKVLFRNSVRYFCYSIPLFYQLCKLKKINKFL